MEDLFTVYDRPLKADRKPALCYFSLFMFISTLKWNLQGLFSGFLKLCLHNRKTYQVKNPELCSFLFQPEFHLAVWLLILADFAKAQITFNGNDSEWLLPLIFTKQVTRCCTSINLQLLQDTIFCFSKKVKNGAAQATASWHLLWVNSETSQVNLLVLSFEIL